MESRIKFRIENYLLFAGVAVDQIYGVRSQNQFQGSTKLSILYRVLTGQNQRRKHEIHSMLFNDIHCFVSYISYIYGLWKPRYLFFPEKTLPTFFCLIHPEFTIHVDWPQESTQTHKFIHHETDPQYGGRCVGCAYFVNSDDHQILLVQLQV